MANATALLLVAELDGYIASTGGFRPAAGLPGRAEMLRVRVHPARRRVGVGSAVMKRLEVDAADRGYRQAWLGAATNQPDAAALHISIGCREIGRESLSLSCRDHPHIGVISRELGVRRAA